MTVELIHVSDFHLMADPEGTLYGINLRARFERLVEVLCQRHRKARVVVATGDLSHDGSSASYQLVEEGLRRLGLPVYALPGNHDHVPTMRRTLSSRPVRTVRTVSMAGWNLVFLDSVVPDRTPGELSTGELRSLDRVLRENPGQPALVALHHHPVLTGSPWMDPLALQAPDRLFAVLDRHPQVQGVLFGHLHLAYEGERNGVRLLGAPSTAFQFRHHCPEPALSDLPPSYRRVVLGRDGALETSVLEVA